LWGIKNIRSVAGRFIQNCHLFVRISHKEYRNKQVAKFAIKMNPQSLKIAYINQTEITKRACSGFATTPGYLWQYS
ncbi:hypothetical protein, partial [Acinetobacter sp. UBA3132]|uniref:hypothetical protein n=1 Tax=Acinetobacter sp. UBA3132 TaxID=1945937 RepID=UPI00257A4433